MTQKRTVDHVIRRSGEIVKRIRIQSLAGRFGIRGRRHCSSELQCFEPPLRLHFGAHRLDKELVVVRDSEGEATDRLIGFHLLL